jgi:hypothetical protein
LNGKIKAKDTLLRKRCIKSSEHIRLLLAQLLKSSVIPVVPQRTPRRNKRPAEYHWVKLEVQKNTYKNTLVVAAPRQNELIS